MIRRLGKIGPRLLRGQQGMTLVELLVAAAVGLILLGGIYQVFTVSSRAYRMDEGLTRLQENGRYVVDFLSREIRMAGYRGCYGRGELINTLNDTGFSYDFETSVQGFEATSDSAWTPALDASITGAVGGSDVLTIRSMASGGAVLRTEINPPSADFKVANGTTSLSDGAIVMISDCSAASIFQITNFTSTNGNVVHNTGATHVPGNATKNLGHVYEPGLAEIVGVATTSYFVRNSASGVPCLFRRTVGAGVLEEELVEGVETLQVRYGVDANNDRSVDDYVAANSVTDWDDVLSVRVGLLMRSVSEISRKPVDTNTYTVNGEVIDPPDDRNLRQVYVTTVSLRNRLP